MNIKITILCLISLCGLKLNLLSAQESVSTSGGNASGTGGSVSYSVGQLVFTNNTGTYGSVAQGIQQAFEISVVSGIEQAKGITLQCTAYPNPVKDYLILKIEGKSNAQYSGILCDINGKILEIIKIEGYEATISMRNYASAIYFLKVIQTSSQQEIKIFKIIKN
jgi:hypothetical protein